MSNAGAPRTYKMINVPPNGKIPEKDIDLNQVIYWAELQATQEEVAGSFRVCVETLNRHLVETIGINYVELKKRVDGNAKMSVRRFQFEQAKKNATMAIWLGKNWLGQHDHNQQSTLPPTHEMNVLKHNNNELQFKVMELEKVVNEFKQKADNQLQRSDVSVQHLGGGCIERQDTCISTETNREAS